MKLIRKTLWK